MGIRFRAGFGLLLVSASCASVAQNAGNENLQVEINALRARLDSLEQQLAASRQQQTVAAPAATAGNNSFNPAMGIIFQGQTWSSQRSNEDSAIQGFPAGGESGPIAEGMSVGETELDFSANVDDKFTAWLTMPVAIRDGEASIELEEAWIETTALPAGFSARLGKFYSGIGYLNNKHAHTWDFVDQPLPYQSLLANQYGDSGVQLHWIAPTDTYLELSAEVLRGDAYPAGGVNGGSAGAWSLYANLGGDVSQNSSWLAGLSFLRSDSLERTSGDESDPLLFTGSSDTLIASAVWKWAPRGNWRQSNAVIQAEYIQQNSDGFYNLSGGPDLSYDAAQNGWYIQGVYQPFPRWRFGARFDTLSSDNSGLAYLGSVLEAPGINPKRYSLMTDWSNSEFSRLRLQYTQDKTGPETDNQLGIQYTFSIGAHGGHSF